MKNARDIARLQMLGKFQNCGFEPNRGDSGERLPHSNTSDVRTDYSYNYLSGQWYHRSKWGGWQTLGKQAGLSSSFLGDGGTYGVGDGWSYYLLPNIEGVRTHYSSDKWAYGYSFGHWSEYDPSYGWTTKYGPEASAALPF